MPQLNFPDKGPGDTFTHDECNQLKNASNANDIAANRASFELFGPHFKEDGTAGVGDDAVPIIKVNGALFDPAIFEMVGDVVTLKASVKALIGI